MTENDPRSKTEELLRWIDYVAETFEWSPDNLTRLAEVRLHLSGRLNAGRPAKYANDDERREANREAMRRFRAKSPPGRIGRPPKYANDDERREAQKAYRARYLAKAGKG